MANEYAVNAADLLAVADAIRDKGENAETLVFPDGFVSAVQKISTGAELNYKVAAYESEDNLPEKAEETTIAVITNTEITGHVFCANEPQTTTEGFVWIKTDEKGKVEFAALKDLTIYLYPVMVKQYVLGEWVNKKTYVYHQTKWVLITQEIYILKGGEIIVGGQYVNASGTSFENGEIVSSSLDDKNGNHGYLSEKIIVDEYNTLRVHVDILSMHSGEYAFSVGMAESEMKSGGYKENIEKFAALKTITTIGEQWVNVDISGISGEYYFAIASIATFSVDEIFLTTEV